MKPTPPGWPRISSAVFYDDAKAAIAFLCEAFGFEEVMVIEGEGGRIEHSELSYGEGLIMVGDTSGHVSGPARVSPQQIEGRNTQALCLFVDDADAHAAHAEAAGAVIADPPKTSDYGEDYWADRTYRAVDLEGHSWWFMQRLRTKGV